MPPSSDRSGPSGRGRGPEQGYPGEVMDQGGRTFPPNPNRATVTPPRTIRPSPDVFAVAGPIVAMILALGW